MIAHDLSPRIPTPKDIHQLSRTYTLVIALLAVGVRLLLIRFVDVDAGNDLRIYHYFGGLMEQGLNPYAPPLDAPLDPHYANIAPFNLAVFAAVLAVWDSPTALRVLFALVDGLIVLSVGLLVARPAGWRKAVMIFYAFNPLVLLSMVVIAQDKVIVIWMMILLVVAVERDRGTPSILLSTLLTLYRWVGAFFILPVALYFARSWRTLVLSLGFFGLLIALSHIPYWPENLTMYASRSARTLIDPPIHASPTILLSVLGLYKPFLVPLIIGGSLAVLYALFAMQRISLVELIVLSTFFTNMGAPEVPLSRILMVTLPLFLILSLSAWRMGLLWIASALAVPFFHVDMARAWFAEMLPTALPGVEWLLQPLPNMLLMNLIPLLFLLYYAADKRAGRVARATILRDKVPPATPEPALPRDTLYTKGKAQLPL